jgi:hypothetical protein
MPDRHGTVALTDFRIIDLQRHRLSHPKSAGHEQTDQGGIPEGLMFLDNPDKSVLFNPAQGLGRRLLHRHRLGKGRSAVYDAGILGPLEPPSHPGEIAVYGSRLQTASRLQIPLVLAQVHAGHLGRT